MFVKMFTVGKLFTNCYVVACEETKTAIIIDPGFDGGFEAEEIFRFIDERGLKPTYVVNTHGHPDHTCGNGIVKEEFSTPIMIHENDAFMLGILGKTSAKYLGLKTYSPGADVLLSDGDFVKFGRLKLKVMHTPGHTPGSVSLIGDELVFTGDTLFAGAIGRTDLPYSSDGEMRKSLLRLLSLPDSYIVYPGHGPKTTIGDEKVYNPFLNF
ncbi:MAG: MBL fold metallo-hydrolase [Candidatus Bathyarchaeia archaeon]